jgi:hypothetical protein
MQSFTVIMIVLLSVSIPILALILGMNHQARLKLREKELEFGAGQSARQLADQAARIEWLEERMRVVERIVTDKGLALADEIERLRGPGAPALRDERIG